MSVPKISYDLITEDKYSLTFSKKIVYSNVCLLKEEKMKQKKEQIALFFIGTITLISFIVIWFIAPIPQDANYHNFADSRNILQVSNFWNVISNVPYFLVGIYAFYKLLSLKSLTIINETKQAYVIFFGGVTLVAFGSGYYHLNPSNETLLWDRLPMTIAFMALFSFVISEFFSLKLGKYLLLPLLFLGMTSVFYWFFSELDNAGDLRAYALVQFLPMLIMPMMFLFFKASFSLVLGYWYLLLCYLLAKVFEHFDSQIYELLGFISGHSLKHIISALGVYILVRTFEKRTINS